MSWLFPCLLIERYLLRRVLGVGLATTAVVLVLLFIYVGKLAYEPGVGGGGRCFVDSAVFAAGDSDPFAAVSLHFDSCCAFPACMPMARPIS